MQVILLEKVANLGNLGDVVKVKDGFARNFLIPSQAGAPRHRSRDQGVRDQARRPGEGRGRQAGRRRKRSARSWPARRSRITQKAGVDGRLFGSVTNADIAEGSEEAGLRGAEGRRCACPNGPIKHTGEHTSRGAAHRRGGRRARRGGRRDRLTASLREPTRRAGFCRPFALSADLRPSSPGLPGDLHSLCPHARAPLNAYHRHARITCITRHVRCNSPRPSTTRSRACACRRTRSRPSRACSAACCSTTGRGTAPATC